MVVLNKSDDGKSHELPKVIIFRHATRSVGANTDPSLNPEGLAQAEQLVEMLAPQGPLPAPTALWVSPKLRARQTFMAIADALSIQPVIDPLLDERQSSESRDDFLGRIRNILAKIENASRPKSCLYLCSHFDWLEEAMPLLPSEMSELEIALPFHTAEYRSFVIEDGLWKLIDRGRAE